MSLQQGAREPETRVVIQDDANRMDKERSLTDWGGKLLEVAYAAFREPTDVLARIVDAAVPVLADACAVDLIVGERIEWRSLVTHVDPLRRSELDDVEVKWGLLPNVAFAALQALQTRRPLLVRPMAPEYFELAAVEPDHFVALVRLALRSWAVVPLVTADGTMVHGVLRLAATGVRQPLEATQLGRAAELGQVGGRALDVACAHRASRDRLSSAESELDRLVATVDSVRRGLIGARMTGVAAAAALGGALGRVRPWRSRAASCELP